MKKIHIERNNEQYTKTEAGKQTTNPRAKRNKQANKQTNEQSDKSSKEKQLNERTNTQTPTNPFRFSVRWVRYAQDGFGETALMEAAAQGQPNLCKLLLESLANVGYRSPTKLRAQDLAADHVKLPSRHCRVISRDFAWLQRFRRFRQGFQGRQAARKQGLELECC